MFFAFYIYMYFECSNLFYKYCNRRPVHSKILFPMLLLPYCRIFIWRSIRLINCYCKCVMYDSLGIINSIVKYDINGAYDFCLLSGNILIMFKFDLSIWTSITRF